MLRWFGSGTETTVHEYRPFPGAPSFSHGRQARRQWCVSPGNNDVSVQATMMCNQRLLPQPTILQPMLSNFSGWDFRSCWYMYVVLSLALPKQLDQYLPWFLIHTSFTCPFNDIHQPSVVCLFLGLLSPYLWVIRQRTLTDIHEASLSE